MSNFLDLTNNIATYYNTTSKNTGIAFDLKDYNGKDIDDAIAKNKGTVDLKLIQAKDFHLAQQRMVDELKKEHSDYYSAHERTMSSKINRIDKLNKNFIGARKTV
jgi:hypothetical protein